MSEIEGIGRQTGNRELWTARQTAHVSCTERKAFITSSGKQRIYCHYWSTWQLNFKNQTVSNTGWLKSQMSHSLSSAKQQPLLYSWVKDRVFQFFPCNSIKYTDVLYLWPIMFSPPSPKYHRLWNTPITICTVTAGKQEIFMLSFHWIWNESNHEVFGCWVKYDITLFCFGLVFY